MKSNKLHIERLKQNFLKGEIISRSRLYDFYKKKEPDTTSVNINWRIHSLLKYHILERIGRGKYIITDRHNFIPEISGEIKIIYDKLKTEFPFLDSCIWNNSLFNEFMLHQPGKFFHLVEVDREAVESVFRLFKENNYNAYLEPDSEIFDRYISYETEPIIIKSLTTEAPLQKISGVITVTLEKILVDIFCDKVIFMSQQEPELERIYIEAFEKYVINEDKLLRYAGRRGKKSEIFKYISSLKNRNVKTIMNIVSYD